MLSIDILTDDELKRVVESMISGMLPHKNYNPENFSSILENTTSYIHLDEYSMEYYVILRALSELDKVKISSQNYQPFLTKETLSDLVEVSAEDLVTRPNIRIKQFLEHEGMNSNIDIQTTRNNAMQILYSRTMELYDRCFALEQDSETVENLVPSLKAAFVSHIGLQSIKAQNSIIIGSLQIGRKVYSGFNDWLEYTTMVATEVKARIMEAEEGNNLLVVNSLAKVSKMDEELKESFIPIANWGIPELDGDGIEAGTPILRHRLVTVVGSVNVGKSMFSKDTATSVVMAGGRVLYMYGEGSAAQVWCDLLINYIYKRFHKFVTAPMLSNDEDLPEDIRKIVQIAKAELVESGAISLREAYNYDTLYEELVKDYKTYHFDLVIIDHSMALYSSGLSATENVHNLAIACRNFKRKYPVCVLVASHPSSDARKYLAMDKRVPADVPTTKESATLEGESDEVFILRDNPTLQKQDLIALENHKRRNAPKLKDYVILSKLFDVCHFVYDPNKQTSEVKDSVSAEEALRELEEAYGEDDSAYVL